MNDRNRPEHIGRAPTRRVAGRARRVDSILLAPDRGEFIVQSSIGTRRINDACLRGPKTSSSVRTKGVRPETSTRTRKRCTFPCTEAGRLQARFRCQRDQQDLDASSPFERMT